jgi:hypothetical protein
MSTVSERYLPVHPDLNQLEQQADEMLQDMRAEQPGATLADAQFALARSYGVASWPRLVLACQMVDAIWRYDARAVRELVIKHPHLLHEMARGTESCNWGPPMTYAANLGADDIIEMLHELGAQDLTWALGRAVLQGRIETARKLYAMGARPPRGAIMGPAETHNPDGMKYLIELGAEISDGEGNRLAPVGMLLATYTRFAKEKHECLELLASHGIELPDTPTMAIHRGRIDLLEEHLRRDPQLPRRTFSEEEIYPPQFGGVGIFGTPLAGTTLLHLCVDYDELEMLLWLLDHGADANAKAVVDADGFGGHTPLFGCVVTAPGTHHDDRLARLLLERGADPNVRVSLRKDGHDYRDVTPLSWGERFHEQDWVNRVAMRVVAERGGHASRSHRR